MRQGILRMENSFLFQFFLISILILCMSNTTNAKNLVYENNWAYLADTVMGGVSRGNAESRRRSGREHQSLETEWTALPCERVGTQRQGQQWNAELYVEDSKISPGQCR